MKQMGTKVIYFTISGRNEQAEFRVDALSEDVKDCFRCAAEAGPYDILKLYNFKGNLVNISPSLPENTSNERYKLEVVAAHCGHCGKDLHGLDVEDVDNRLQKLEKHVFVDEGGLPAELISLKNRVDNFKMKLENVEHLSWLGLFKDMNIGPSALPYNSGGDDASTKRTEKEYQHVLDSFLKMGSGLMSEDVLDKLRMPTFDNWQWEDAEMMFLVQQMFVDLGLVETFHIEMPKLQQFIFEVYKHYNLVPFHNFRHSFCVTQMMYGMICLSGVNTMIAPHEVLIMLVSAFCHDLDHPGYNNVYQVNARTELAIRYNDISPLENHHAAVAFDILSQQRCNIFSNIKQDLYKKIREGIIKLILATDMARHNELLNEFKGIMEGEFDWLSSDHRLSMLKMFIKAADVSNETRPMDVSEPWLECLLQEFFQQSDAEKLEGLPTAAFMDREKVTKSSAQIGFIKFVLIPLYEILSVLFPDFEEFLLKPIQKAFDYYVEMGREMEEEKREKQEKQAKKFSADDERKLDIEISRKLSREFDIRLTAEIQKKFSEDKERKLSGDFRHLNGSGNNSRKVSQDRKVSDYHTPPQFSSPPTSNNPSPLPSHNKIDEHYVNDKPNEEETHDLKVSSKTVFIAFNDQKVGSGRKFSGKQRNSVEEKPFLSNGVVVVENAT
ncbi:high affinity cGMP-specific 3',5'-cyclic phosphodiesterase 9A-like [Hydractinia symbiolongicarpus]|uniref:high affinity cGMP-specific 3',5'-cyclic phosphodiesterase 9A-like n=1 Tax=Hydractinia symbiolongicarpus TaxID=13093 RepID=UPI00254EB010|nr:high affinity cGMP-specific 3',5'-cyclic phosphodiesterase 9A-like [Hydractinia symbiolongicarpus]